MSVKLEKKPETAAARIAKLDEMARELPIVTAEDYVTATKITTSGSITLDMAIGIGGYPDGCIIDSYGGESAGKSLLSIMYMAQVQKSGGVAAVWDVERSYTHDTAWLEVNGVNPKQLRFIQLEPKQGCEHGMDAVEKIASSGLVDLIVVDSIPAMVPQAALDRPLTKNDLVMARANKLSQHIARLNGLIGRSKTTVMFINQIRANLHAGPFGDPEKETSIAALKHHAALRMRVTKLVGKKWMKFDSNNIPIGHRVRVKVVKNKLAAPFRTAEFDLFYTKGVDHASEIAGILLGADIAKQGGAWIEYGKEKFQGASSFLTFLREPKNFEKAMSDVRKLLSEGRIMHFGRVKDEDGPEGAVTIDEAEENDE